MMGWAWKVGTARRAGLSPGQFVRRELNRLQLGETLTVVRQSGRNLRLPPPAGSPERPAAQHSA